MLYIRSPEHILLINGSYFLIKWPLTMTSQKSHALRLGLNRGARGLGFCILFELTNLVSLESWGAQVNCSASNNRQHHLIQDEIKKSFWKSLYIVSTSEEGHEYTCLPMEWEKHEQAFFFIFLTLESCSKHSITLHFVPFGYVWKFLTTWEFLKILSLLLEGSLKRLMRPGSSNYNRA